MASLVSIQITPDPLNVFLGTTGNLTVTATYSDSTTANVTTTSQWSSASLSVAKISSSGVVTPGNIGTTSIQAVFNGLSDTATIAVRLPILASGRLTVNAPQPSVSPKGTARVYALQILDDSQTYDISDLVTWSSSDTTVATVDSHGTVTSVAVGTTTISASLNGVTATKSFTVADPLTGFALIVQPQLLV